MSDGAIVTSETPAPETAVPETPAPEPPPPENRIEAMIRAVEKIQSLGELSGAAKAVLIRLTLRYPGKAVRAECPPPAELAPWLGLSERSIRRAYAELESAGFIPEPQDEDGGPLPGHGTAALQDGWPYLVEGKPMDLDEHVAHLEWLRDLAVSRGRIGIAVTAEKAAGRALGFYDHKRGRTRPPFEVAKFGRGQGETYPGTDGPESAKAGTPPARSGAERAGTGANWHELAETGMAHRTPEGSGMFNKYKALMGDFPA